MRLIELLALVAALAACRSQSAPSIPWNAGKAEHLAVRGPERREYPINTRIANMELRSPEGGSDGFGASISLAAHTAVIGAPGAVGGGAAWVMDPRDPSKPWTRLEPPADPQVIGFGESVAVSPDGRWIAVGAPRSTVDGMPESGRVFLWERIAGGCRYAQSLISEPVIEGALLGTSLAIGVLETPFGSAVRRNWTLLAGAPRVRVHMDVNRGVAFLWSHAPGGSWQQSSILKWALPRGTRDTGDSSSSGRTADEKDDGLITSLQHSQRSLGRGSALFGQSADIVLSRDFSGALVGAPDARTAVGHHAGGASLYTPSREGWRSTPSTLLAGSLSQPLSHFGQAVGLAADLAVVGAPQASIPALSAAGRVFVFRNLKVPNPTQGDKRRVLSAWTEEAALVAPRPGPAAAFGSSVAITAECLVAGSPQAAVDGTPSAGVAFTFQMVTPFQPSDPKWMPESELRSRDPAAAGRFGDQVKLTGDCMLVSEPRPGSGVVHLFIRANDAWGLPMPGSEPASATEATTPQPETAAEPAETGAASPATPATSGQVPLPV